MEDKEDLLELCHIKNSESQPRNGEVAEDWIKYVCIDCYYSTSCVNSNNQLELQGDVESLEKDEFAQTDLETWKQQLKNLRKQNEE